MYSCYLIKSSSLEDLNPSGGHVQLLSDINMKLELGRPSGVHTYGSRNLEPPTA
jgi:hypothetical protein